MSALLLALVLTATSELPPRPTRVTVDVPAECPPGLFERELAFRTDRVVQVTTEAEASAWIEVKVSAKKKRFDGQLKVRAGGLATSKKLSGPRCESVIGALSLAAALVLDPEGAKTGPLPPEVLAPPPPPAPQPPPAPPAPEPPAPVAIVAPPPPEIVVSPPPPPPAATPRATPSFSVFATGVISTGLSAQPDFGAGAGVEFAVALPTAPISLLSHLAIAGVSGRTITSAQGQVEYLPHVFSQLGLGVGAELGAFRPELGAAVQLMPVLLRGIGADEVLSSQRWLWSLGPTARLMLRLGAWRIAAGAALAANLRHERYLIDPNGAVLTVPSWFVSGGLEVGRALF